MPFLPGDLDDPVIARMNLSGSTIFARPSLLSSNSWARARRSTTITFSGAPELAAGNRLAAPVRRLSRNGRPSACTAGAGTTNSPRCTSPATSKRPPLPVNPPSANPLAAFTLPTAIPTDNVVMAAPVAAVAPPESTPSAVSTGIASFAHRIAARTV